MKEKIFKIFNPKKYSADEMEKISGIILWIIGITEEFALPTMDSLLLLREEYSSLKWKKLLIDSLIW